MNSPGSPPFARRFAGFSALEAKRVRKGAWTRLYSLKLARRVEECAGSEGDRAVYRPRAGQRPVMTVVFGRCLLESASLACCRSGFANAVSE